MTITTVDGLLAGFTTARQKTPLSKSVLNNMTIGQAGSYWRSAGNPGVGALPVAPVTCNQNTLGGLIYNLPTNGQITYLARVMLAISSAGSSVEIHDRLANMGGLSGIVTTAQTVGIDLAAMGATDNINQRRGRSDYSVVQWWIECYGQTGTTATNLQVNVTDQNGQSFVTFVSIPGNFRAGALLPILTGIPGSFIRSVESVTLLASTGSAGNFGVTATVQRSEITMPITNVGVMYDWVALGLPVIFDSSCLFFIGNSSSSTLGALNGALTLIQG